MIHAIVKNGGGSALKPKKTKKNRVLHIIPQMMLDAVCVYLAYFLAMVLRLSDVNVSTLERLIYMEAFGRIMPLFVLLCLAIFVLFKFYRTIWEFAGSSEMMQIVAGGTLACGIGTGVSWAILQQSRFPISVYVAGWLLTLAFIGSVRMSYRLIRRVRRRNLHRDGERQLRVMVIGAGEMGSMVIKEMKSAPESVQIPVCAIDDDRSKKGTRINGVKVVGTRESIPRMAARYDVDQIILAIPSARNSDKRAIIDICSRTGCQLKTVPALYEILEGNEHVVIRDVDIVDLLGRDEITLNTEEISSYLHGKTVLVTGGGGSIGSELCRQIALFRPHKLLVFDIYENNAYDLQQELHRKYPWLDFEVLIGSVRDRSRLSHVFEAYHPEVVFHAAAHKHVPLMELSPGEAVKNNVFGTWNVATCADQYGVRRMVLISTDKAVNPTNIMGATKRICELIIQYYSRHSKTEYVAVRFGNVLGSSGSVIPLFKRQIEAGGPVTVTHPDIIRYFMTIPEAAQLVIQAGGMAKGGEIFILDMGKPVKILDLAEKLIQLSGYEPYKDIDITFTGLRPGEKLYEELLLDCEGGCEKTAHELIYIGSPTPVDEDVFLCGLAELRECAGVDNRHMMEVVHRLVPTYTGHAEKSDLLARASAEKEEENPKKNAEKS